LSGYQEQEMNQSPELLFVYGTLMTGQSAHKMVAPAVERRAPAALPQADLYHLGAYPMAAVGDGVVRGEVLWLRPQVAAEFFTRLDEYEGAEYLRIMRPVLLCDTGDVVSAWVYLGDAEYASRFPHIRSGDWRELGGEL
jgi:gamma-glutamylcyclotransferase (GGCT)/AIG2-like uncharacterized protein YtfP